MKNKTYKAQQWNTDFEDWEDMEDVQSSSDKYQVQEEARYQANKCAYKVRTRVIEE